MAILQDTVTRFGSITQSRMVTAYRRIELKPRSMQMPDRACENDAVSLELDSRQHEIRTAELNGTAWMDDER